MELTKDKLRALRVAMDAALAQVAKEQGLKTLRAGNCTYDRSGGFTFKVEGIVDGGLSQDEQRYEDNRWLGLPARGATFKSGGDVHTCWGLTRGSKVITTCSNGKQYKWPVDAIHRFFPNEKRPLTHAELLSKGAQ